ncbi:hypothetical protein [Actinocatenispora rupis]|uniref:Uncharacterized protein n=1 Tax=Actinocatenispora rupis TaxID=519421 RepID=A0A8J3NE78_9ACTN|nr:hypothetical protein [Actinocatenispora rupis]GID12299.1 hypothetical protein Aru02nite_31880 [Actinocatenispora rupis]
MIKEVTGRFVVAKRIRLEAREPGTMGWVRGRTDRPTAVTG